MASELCVNCFRMKGHYDVCPYCGYVEGTPAAQPHFLTPGTILGNHFIVGTVIGVGGFGITYKCFDNALGVTVAAKEFYPSGLVNRAPGESKVGVLPGEKKEQYKIQLKRFLMEAQSVAQFGKAKDIVNVYDFFEENGTAYMIMEYIDGLLLKDYLKKQGVMPPNAAMSAIMPIIQAVKKIHSKGIIHRDISPDNIFITNENSIKIFDFGAALLNESKEGLAGEKVIKVGYSAPEQYRDNKKQGFYTDIYSVGAILYQMLTGKVPVESTEREYKDGLKSPMELGVKINANVDRAIMEAMAVRPELRIQNIQHFEDALWSKRAAEYPKEKVKKRKRKIGLTIGLAAIAVLAVGVGVGLSFSTFKSKNKLFATEIKNSTSINVWVENEDQKSQLDDIINNGFKKGELSADDQQNPSQWKKFWSQNEKVKVDVTVHEDLQKDLEAARDGEKPNMYLVDHVADESKKDLISLEDIYEELDVDEYAYMSEYKNYFPEYKELPTGLDTLLLYVCTIDDTKIDYSKDNRLSEKSAYEMQDDATNTVNLEDIIDDNKGNYYKKEDDTQYLSDKLAVFADDTPAGALVLQNSDAWKPYFSGEKNEMPDDKALKDIEAFREAAEKPEYMVSGKEGVYGSNIVAGAAFRKQMEKAAKKDDAANGQNNPLKSYQTRVVVSGDKMLVTFSERYGIVSASDDEQLACKRLLYLMMQERFQAKKVSYSSETAFPIRRAQLDNFPTVKANMGSFVKLCKDEYKCEIIGDITGNMYQYLNSDKKNDANSSTRKEEDGNETEQPDESDGVESEAETL